MHSTFLYRDGRRACATTTKPVRWAPSRTRQAMCESLHSEGLFACSGHGVQHGHGVHASYGWRCGAAASTWRPPRPKRRRPQLIRNGTYLSIDGNGELCGGTPQLHLAPCSTTTAEKNRKQLSKSFGIILASMSGIVFIVFVVAIFQIIRKKLTQIQGSQLVPMAVHEQTPIPCAVKWKEKS